MISMVETTVDYPQIGEGSRESPLARYGDRCAVRYCPVHCKGNRPKASPTGAFIAYCLEHQRQAVQFNVGG